MNPYRLRAYILLLIVSVVWGLAGPVIKFTLSGIDPLPFLTYRFGLSSLVAIATFFLLGLHLPQKRETLLEILLFGLITSTVALGLLFLGLDKTTVLDMTLIVAVGPLLIALAGVMFLNEHITSREKVGMGIAFSGSLLTLFEPVISSGVNFSQLTGNILVLGYLLANTFSAVLVKRLVRREVSPITLVNISFIIGFVTIAPITLIFYGGDFLSIVSQLEIPFHLGVIYMALLSGNLAYALWIKGQKTIEIGEAALFAYLYPIFSAPLAVIWLKERITTPFIIGAILITIGVLIAEYKKRQNEA